MTGRIRRRNRGPSGVATRGWFHGGREERTGGQGVGGQVSKRGVGAGVDWKGLRGSAGSVVVPGSVAN